MKIIIPSATHPRPGQFLTSYGPNPVCASVGLCWARSLLAGIMVGEPSPDQHPQAIPCLSPNLVILAPTKLKCVTSGS